MYLHSSEVNHNNNESLRRVESFCWGFTRRAVVFFSEPIFFRIRNPDQVSDGERNLIHGERNVVQSCVEESIRIWRLLFQFCPGGNKMFR